ncbi:MAG: GNAT family N-acetyltransferase [Rhizobiales bacterium]|nr:GNAT family N-acetyltransferase [Hyphomicrobiales bacterium]
MSVIETPAIDELGIGARPGYAAAGGPVRELVNIETVPGDAWAALAERAIEPNVFFDPNWARAVVRHARGHAGAKALLVWADARREHLIGLLPVTSAWHALRLPVPVLVAWQAYAPLTTPLLDRDATNKAAHGLLDAAAKAGAVALLLPHLPASGATAATLRRVLEKRGAAPKEISRYARARLDARQDPQNVLRHALSAKKLKELRRQRHRLADNGAVTFEVARKPAEISVALEDFLVLESGGWKGQRATALAKHDGDSTFIREAAAELAVHGKILIATLRRGGTPVAGGIMLRQGHRAFFFKIAHDERLSKMSPGVQLTLDMTQHVCADARIDDVDSMAHASHPMINHIWREHLELVDLYVPICLDDPNLTLIRRLIVARNVTREVIASAFRCLRAIKEKYR